jgi:LPXTG-motif cell wall-anchored protein
MKWIESYAKKEVFYMAKRRSKKKQQKMIRSFITLAIVIILGLFSMIVQPWKYIDSDKDPIGGKSEINENDLQVHYIDVGQADCILIRVPTKDGLKNMLIDAGTSDGYKQQVILDYLDGQGVETLEYMIVTHPHADHNAAALKVLKTYSVKVNNEDTNTYTWANNGKDAFTTVYKYTDKDGKVVETTKLGEFLSAATNIVNTNIGTLPSTGGMGTVLFTVAGAAIMALAIFLLFGGKKKQHQK